MARVFTPASCITFIMATTALQGSISGCTGRHLLAGTSDAEVGAFCERYMNLAIESGWLHTTLSSVITSVSKPRACFAKHQLSQLPHPCHQTTPTTNHQAFLVVSLFLMVFLLSRNYRTSYDGQSTLLVSIPHSHM